MNGLWQHLAISLRLHFRNRMALLYGYLFPLVFLAAFWVLYRHEKIPLLRHLGELLTVSVLGGACFGLPTTLVSERERGVWRRYRLAPVPTWAVVTSTAIARYAIVLTAGLLQFAVALAVGMTAPAHPFDLWLAFTAVSFAFIGLGLVIAMLADNVPAVQALGQCIFLPMLIIGGVAVQLASLPAWAQHVSAFFPGRYAVEALQTAVTGRGFAGARFSLLALVLIGAAGCVAGAKLFRWDARQRFSASAGRVWLLPVFAAWFAVGGLAEWRGRVAISVDAEPAPAVQKTPPVASPPATASPAVATPLAVTPKPVAEPAWMKLTAADIAKLDFSLPPDGGVVAPIAPPGDPLPEYVAPIVSDVRDALRSWKPGLEGDPVTRVRHLLCVCAVPDAVQIPVEAYIPAVVLAQILPLYTKENLLKILAWIAMNPEEGDVITDVTDVGIDGAVADALVVRERVNLYALKFLLRVDGRKAL
jgi:ABC-2 type transport system permease protein